MANPPKYTRLQDYSAATLADLRSNLNPEFSDIESKYDPLVEAIKDIRRSDGALVNEIVTLDSLHPDVENYLDGQLATAQGYANDAQSSANDAQSSANDAATSATEAASSATAAANSATEADGHAADAEQAAAGVEEMVNVSGAVYVDTYAGLKGFTDDDTTLVVRGRDAVGDGGHGIFAWVSGDQSSKITDDPGGGLWVAPFSDVTGASGAWERQHNPGHAQAAWWGFKPSATAADNVTAWENATKGLMNLYDGGTLYLESGEYEIDAEITVIQRIGVQGSQKSTIKLMAAGARIYVNNDGYGFTGLFNVRAGSLRDFYVDGALTADVGIRCGPTPHRHFDNVQVQDCTAYCWQLDKTQNCTFTNCRGEGFGADGSGNISPIQGASLHLANEQRNCVFTNCHFGNKTGQHGVAYVLANWDSSLPNYDGAAETARPKNAATQNTFVGGIAERGDVEHAIRIESGQRNQFLKFGLVTDTGGANLVTTVHLGANAEDNVFQSINMQSGSGTAYVDAQGARNMFLMPYFVNTSPTAIFRYSEVLIVQGIAGAAYNASTLFDNQTGGDPADYLRFTPNEPDTTSIPWTADTFVDGMFDNTGKRMGAFDGAVDDVLWSEAYTDRQTVTDGTVTLSAHAKMIALNSTGAGITATLPDPKYSGQEVTVYATGVSGSVDVTTDSATIRDGSNGRTSMAFGSLFDRVHLVALTTNQWAVVSSHGVVFS